MQRSPALRDRIATGILDAATAVFSIRGDATSMGDVATAAGVSRATLYRYFPTREELVRALRASALRNARARLDQADLNSVPVPDALARLTRALVTTGAHYTVVLHEQGPADRADAARLLGEPIRSVFRRGVDDGSLRADRDPERLTALYAGLIGAAIQMTADGLGVEDACDEVVAVVLDGVRARP